MTTKEKLLKTALKLFAKQGIDKTSTSQITEKVAVASGTLFVHYKTKQQLIDTLYLNIKKEAFGPLAAMIDEKTSVELNFKRITKKLIDYFVSHYDAFVFMQLVENDPQISPKTVEAAQEFYRDITKAFKNWQKEGALKKIDLSILGGMIWSMMTVIIRSMKVKKTKRVKSVYLQMMWEAIRR